MLLYIVYLIDAGFPIDPSAVFEWIESEREHGEWHWNYFFLWDSSNLWAMSEPIFWFINDICRATKSYSCTFLTAQCKLHFIFDYFIPHENFFGYVNNVIICFRTTANYSADNSWDRIDVNNSTTTIQVLLDTFVNCLEGREREKKLSKKGA